MRHKIVIGNWKMNPLTIKEAEKLFGDVAKALSRIQKTEVIICAPFIYLERLSKIRTSKVKLGAQNAFWGDQGAFSGEVSMEMLYELGVKNVILGHSERRALGEKNDFINKKIKGAISSGLMPILCVGEESRDQDHQYFNIVKTQIKECLQGVSRNLASKIMVAYEPVWSISSTPNRRDATSADSYEMAMFIRKILSDIFSPEIAKDIKVIYGGSVNERDASEFLKDGGVDGVLPGRASLDSEKFIEIVKIAESLS
ncbi:triose-phosphate isomerase [Candidatus Nomurabacteria bacterium]|nr:triose-phosphate isomerase [Candidatus Nomurabacteria bacterium]